MQTRVQHNNRKTEDIASVRVRENPGIQLTIAFCEALHHPVDFLRFPRETERPEELAEGLRDYLLVSMATKFFKISFHEPARG